MRYDVSAPIDMRGLIQRRGPVRAIHAAAAILALTTISVANAQTPPPPSTPPPAATATTAPSATATSATTMTVRGRVPLPAGATVEVQGFDAATRSLFTCGTTTSESDSSAPGTSTFTVVVSGACAASYYPPRILVNGQFAGTFTFVAGSTIDVGLLELTPLGQPGTPRPPNLGNGGPESAAGPVLLPATGDDQHVGGNDRYLYAAYGFLASAALIAALSAGRYGMRLRRLPRR